jgi:hypothetical protein
MIAELNSLLFQADEIKTKEKKQSDGSTVLGEEFRRRTSEDGSYLSRKVKPSALIDVSVRLLLNCSDTHARFLVQRRMAPNKAND